MTTATTVVKDVAYTGQVPVNTQPRGAEVLEVAIPINFPVAAPVGNDVHLLCKLMPGVKVLDFTLLLDDVDSGAAAVLAVGEADDALADIDVVYQGTITLGQTGGLLRHSAASAAAGIVAIGAATLNTERTIGLKWTTAAGTYVPSKTGVLILKLIG